MNIKFHLLSILTLGLLAAGCRDPLPCSDCEVADEEADPDLPADTPDLPCEGADLSSDPSNCGECGNICPTAAWAGTEWEAGGCVDGACAPTWSGCRDQLSNPAHTCSQWCISDGGTCIANACAGHTGIYTTTNPFDPRCWPDTFPPYAEHDGGCDDPLSPPPVEDGVGVEVQCCCSYE
jgi:hypothetical protein